MTNTTTTADKGELPGAKEPRFTFSKEWCLRMAELDEGDECGAGVETLPSPLHLQVAAIAVKYCHCKNPESTTLDERYDITKFDCVEDVLSFAQELVRTFGRPADKGEQECREAFEKWAIAQEWIAPVKNHEPFSRECYPDGDYDITVVRAAWAAWNRRPTNEGQDGLTEDEVWQIAEQTLNSRTIKASTGYDIHFFARAIERALNQRLAVEEEQ